MDSGSDEDSNRNMNHTPPEGAKKPKRQMKTPFQLETLEKTYANETYPSEATRLELSNKLGLSDRQLQMWFCHRRLKDKKESQGTAAKPRASATVGKRSSIDSPQDEIMGSEHVSRSLSGSRSGSGSESGSGSSQFDNGDDMPKVPIRYYESPRTLMARRVIACVEVQLGEPLREDGPILGVEFDLPPPDAFGAPIVTTEHRDQFRKSYEKRSCGSCETQQIKTLSGGLHKPTDSKIRTDAYGKVAPTYLYDSPGVGPSGKIMSSVQANGHLPQSSSDGKQGHLHFPSPNDVMMSKTEEIMQMDRKRKNDETRSEREAQANEKKIRKELEKQDLLRRKMEEQMRKEMEKQDRERRKEEQRNIREQQKKEERYQREEKREMERREKLMQRELLRAERNKQKEDSRRERELAKQKAAMERAAAKRIAKESLELIEDEWLELMELAAGSKGLPLIASLDFDTLQGLESFRGSLCKFPPDSVKLKKPFAIHPWIDSEENVGNLLMVWRFCITFADLLGLWPFTLDEFVQAFHDYDSRLLGEVHIALLKMIIKDIVDVVRTPTGGPGTNQYSVINPEGGHPRIVEGAYAWGFDIRSWQKHLNPLTWPEILRQFSLAAGYGPELKKKSSEPGGLNDNDENKGCEDIVSTLRNGSAAQNAVNIMREKGFSLNRKSRHRLTPGTVKFAAYHVLALEGSRGLNVIDLADKIQKSGLRDLTTSKTPEASISVALSRDPVLFERIAPSTYNVRPAYRKDPADAEAILSEAREKIQRFVNGGLSGQNAEDEEGDDDSDCDVAEGPEVDDLGTPSDANKIIAGCNEDVTSTGDGKIAGTSKSDPGAEIDESRSGQPWVQGLTEGEYSELSVEERLNALVVLVGIANEGNSIRLILEDRLDAANALKKQMWAEAQFDKRRIKEDFVAKFSESTYGAADGTQSPLALADNKYGEASPDNGGKDEPDVGMDNDHNQIDNFHVEKNSLGTDSSFGRITNSIQQNSLTAERSRMQMKAFIGHTAEEIYVYRSLPLGLDRRRNRYWLFVASPSSHDPGSGRIFVESPDGFWRLIDSKEAFDALLTSLDMRGVRESHLHIMLKKIEVPFRERVQSLSCGHVPWIDGVKTFDGCAENHSRSDGSSDAESPSSVCITNFDPLEPSSSFKVELGRNEAERENALKRYQDLQLWTWKECFNPTVLRAISCGKNRRTPLLGICSLCVDCYLNMEGQCCSCNQTKKIENREQSYPSEEKVNAECLDSNFSNSSQIPLRIRLIKVLLNSIEASVPSEALQSFWTEDLRETWASKLLKSSCTDDLLQVLTQFEGAIKRDSLSSSFETTEELLSYCASLKSASFESSSGSIPRLPWIPPTTAAVSLRLLDLDASISFGQHQKPDVQEEKKEHIMKLPSRYANKGSAQKVQSVEWNGDKHMKGESWEYTGHASSSSEYKQSIRARGIARPRGKLQKGPVGLVSETARQSAKHVTLTQVLMQQGEGLYGQKHGRGRRTVRRRRIEKKIVEEKLPDGSGVKVGIRTVSGLARHTGPVEKAVTTNVTEVEDSSSSSSASDDDGVDSDDNAPETTYNYGKWSAGFSVAPPTFNSEMMEVSEEEADDSEDDSNAGKDDAENLEDGEELGLDDDDCDSNRNMDRNGDEKSDSVVSGDYSD